jgi:hypothetical protein
MRAGVVMESLRCLGRHGVDCVVLLKARRHDDRHRFSLWGAMHCSAFARSVAWAEQRRGLVGGRSGLHAQTATEQSGSRGGEFRADVEGLRAVAIFLVVLYHTHTGVTGGYVGVDVFFVISGFLITRQLVRELSANGKISLMGFYARRARRILPAAALTTMVTVVAAGLLLSPLPAMRVFSDARAAALWCERPFRGSGCRLLQ